jgi:hypothetical protein
VAKLQEAGAANKPQAERDDLQRQVEQQEKELAESQSRPPQVNHPRTNRPLTARTLDGSTPVFAKGVDPRAAFADWAIASPEFAGAMVNRLWRHFFATGLVESVDDLRASNPPSNAELWQLLGSEFRGHGYDLRHIMRLILTSRAYQLSATTRPENQADQRFFSHYYARRLPAEVMLDALASATGVPDEFPGYPTGLRAVQLPDTGVASYFLTLFGRSDRVTACACERKGEVTLPQLLNLQNGEEIERQLKHNEGRLASLLKNPDDTVVLNTLYLTCLARLPSEAERSLFQSQLGSDPRDVVYRDLFWALLNSKEFTFNH